eukprot:365278-Chlamydomonas_euryale.AAC.3
MGATANRLGHSPILDRRARAKSFVGRDAVEMLSALGNWPSGRRLKGMDKAVMAAGRQRG